MFALCQVCGKKIMPTKEPWVLAYRAVAKDFNLCYIHFYCYDHGMKTGKILGIKGKD